MNSKNDLPSNPFAGRFETAAEKRQYVLNLFSALPEHYDRMNRVMSLGLDMSWRRKTIRRAQFNPSGCLLDLATGTGDMILAARQYLPSASFVGVDFCPPFLTLAKEKLNGHPRLHWVQGDAMQLPLADESIDGAFTAFALRNVINVEHVFTELYRVTRPGGKVASLEMVKQSNSILRKIFGFYFRHIIPRLGRWLTSFPDAYSYLPLSIENFYTATELDQLIRRAGWRQVQHYPVMFGNVAIHVATK
ncbi:MAG: ubiquinone/menaquinone biosynthesis methyltransferase [candidate division KSB1 bacterium]|nr:ubiquinone/menaquinone biosynthesis methyltransferase [candidate division KSB1 bacterium]MDZ7319183.1 ubiquinone/menaquinone biosynthesis methyltransferase [candidate division KSB1 bacterium]MDZ7339774.1 ubiquinone/menaquinone biosynthesis methyltransferase [candidate division KSB1 bacterium]